MKKIRQNNTKTLVNNQLEVAVELDVIQTQPRKQVGIIGGTFNPPHVSHLIIADQVQAQLDLDKIYFMPSFLPPHVDEKKTIAAAHRLKMVELAIEDNPKFAVETCEIDRKGTSYTYDTMKMLMEKNPDTDYYFIIGGDMVAYLPKWYRVDELSKLVQFVGVRRPNYAETSDYPIIWVDVPSMQVSSTYIRDKVAAGCSVKYLLPDKVRMYVEAEGLYRNE